MNWLNITVKNDIISFWKLFSIGIRSVLLDVQIFWLVSTYGRFRDPNLNIVSIGNKRNIVFRSEYGAFWKCIQAGGIYIFTQLVKMLALATFFPTADNVGQEGFDVFGVCIYIHIFDIIFYHFYNQKLGFSLY